MHGMWDTREPAAMRGIGAHMTAHAMTTKTMTRRRQRHHCDDGATHSHSESAATTLADLTESIRPTLEAVERLFNQELTSDLRVRQHAGQARQPVPRQDAPPVLVLLSGRALRRADRRAHVTIATVVEMVHMATLVHDDVLDEAELRRKGATINHLRGNEAAVLLGRLPDQPQLSPLLQPRFAARQPR